MNVKGRQAEKSTNKVKQTLLELPLFANALRLAGLDAEAGVGTTEEPELMEAVGRLFVPPVPAVISLGELLPGAILVLVTTTKVSSTPGATDFSVVTMVVLTVSIST